MGRGRASDQEQPALLGPALAAQGAHLGEDSGHSALEGLAGPGFTFQGTQYIGGGGGCVCGDIVTQNLAPNVAFLRLSRLRQAPPPQPINSSRSHLAVPGPSVEGWARPHPLPLDDALTPHWCWLPKGHSCVLFQLCPLSPTRSLAEATHPYQAPDCSPARTRRVWSPLPTLFPIQWPGPPKTERV